MNGYASDSYLDWYAVDTGLTDTSTSVNFDINKSYGTGTVPLKQGEECKVGSMTVHIDSVKAAPDKRSWNGMDREQKAWEVSVTLSGFSGPKLPNISGRILDSKGDIISRVDKSGDPIKDEPAKAGAYPGFQMNRGFDASLQVTGGFGTNKQVLFLPANPSKVSALSLTANGIRRITITDLLLDPK
jgi:hypothetical protein